MRLRRLSQQGLQELADELERVRSGETKALSRDLESSDRFSAEVKPVIELPKQTFKNRFAVAEYLFRCLGDGVLEGLEEDIGVWGWLSGSLFDQLCPLDNKGRRQPGELARWIPDPSNFQRYYRHLLAGPYRMYRLHKDNTRRAMAMLWAPLDKPGELYEQLVSRQEMVTNPAIMDTAISLYFDRTSSEPKRGAAGKGAGSARRLAKLIGQFDVTWDLNLLSAAQLMTMLPGEFTRFKT
jgi:hypothetical protein